MNRERAIALQRRGIRVPAFDERCGWCHRPSTYHRDLDRYTHDDGSPHADCWLHLARGDENMEPVAAQAKMSHRDSRFAVA